jgi:predicted transcriptional regulator
MKVLLSIKPKFAQKIFDGTKQFEFRKAIYKNKEISTIVVYASYPIQKVIGEFKVEYILSNHPDVLWEKTKDQSGISRAYFGEYFEDRNVGFAIKVSETKEYLEPLCLKKDFNINFPPQSFMYLKDE